MMVTPPHAPVFAGVSRFELIPPNLVEAKPSLALLPFGADHPVGTVRSPTIRCNGEYSECHEQEEDNHVFLLSSWSDQEWFITAFIRTVVSLLRVYLVEGRSTSVELHILTTHLHRG
jgi:hypothetical protein